MSLYDDEYYIVHNMEGDDHIFLNATKNTASRKYGYVKNDRISEPFFFYNDNKSSSLKYGDVDIMLDGVDMVVSDRVREIISAETVKGLQFNSAVFIDEDDKWHEGLWYLTFYERLACLDVKDSEALRGDLSAYGPKSIMTVNKYSLDAKKLDSIPLDERLIFKIGGTSFSYVFVHESIRDAIISSGIRGVRFFKVSEFEEGDQYY